MNVPSPRWSIPSKKFYVAIGIMALLGLGACETLASLEAPNSGLPNILAPSTPIRDVATGKSKQAVYITGKVTAIAPLVNGAAYELEDETGKIWVLGKTAAPDMGKTVTIKGTPRFQSLRLEGKERGAVYLEQE